MRLARLPKRVGPADLDVDGAVPNQAEHLIDGRKERFARGVEVVAADPLEIERSLVHEIERLDLGKIPRRIPIADEEAQRRKTFQVALVGGGADPVKNNRYAGAAGDFVHSLGEVLGGVVDNVMTPVRAGNFRLLFARRGADDGCAQCRGPLAGDQSHTAGNGVNEDGLAGLHLVARPNEIVRGQALDDHRRGDPIFDVIGNRHREAFGKIPHLGI